MELALHWRHHGRDGVSNHRRLYCLLNRLFRRKSKNTSKLRVTGLCEGNSPVTGEFPAQRTSNVKNVPCDGIIMGMPYFFPYLWTSLESRSVCQIHGYTINRTRTKRQIKRRCIAVVVLSIVRSELSSSYRTIKYIKSQNVNASIWNDYALYMDE